jgi:hypothetical protein
VGVPNYAELKNLALDRAGLNPQQTILSCGTLLNNTAVSSAVLFGSIVPGMQVTGTGIPAGTTVVSGGGSASPSALVISQQSTAANGTYSLTFYGPDAPVSDAEFARYINDALRDVWEMSGGRLKTVPSATAWTSSETALGTVTGILTDVQEIVHLHQTSQAPVVVSCVEVPGYALTLPSGTFPATIVPRMVATGAHVAAGAIVMAVATDRTSVTLSALISGSQTENVTFSPVDGTEMERKPLSYIHYLNSFPGGYGSYTKPKVYAITRIATPSAGTTNLLQLDYWPGVSGFYFPLAYVPQFLEIDAVTNTVPDVNDLEARDAALMAAIRLAVTYGRPEFVPNIFADLSTRGQEIMQLKAKAVVSADSG